MRYPVKQNIAVQIKVWTSNVMLKQSSTITANLRNEWFCSTSIPQIGHPQKQSFELISNLIIIIYSEIFA